MQEIVRAMNYVIEQGLLTVWVLFVRFVTKPATISSIAPVWITNRELVQEIQYNDGIPDGSRMSIPWFKSILSNGLEEKSAKAIQLAEIAKEIGCTLPQLAIAWCVANTNVSTVLLGASRIEQLDENLRALEFEDKITPEIRAKIDTIADVKPELTKVQDNVHQMRGKWQ
ncbi:hypothetical protein PC121_g15531 [Phytophthora cactorum]|nr:hypothetical protein PC120_g14278 [Phytophthora cactorum]KAG3055923.1 hypothetical protein PC121_g15531 [Phytophthora cactorum]KAG4050217.1 hypothetical protein PC123_g14530 [Phytophthora cactorum]